MNFDEIIKMIAEEPIYLSIFILFALIIIYSVLKKFFKLLVIILSALILYLSFLIYSGEELPGNSDEIIDPLIDNASNILDVISKQLKQDNEE
mgnify:CR=1 FL=1